VPSAGAAIFRPSFWSYTATLVPEGKFAAVASNLGPLPIAFAQLQNDENGKPTILRLTLVETAQAYDFRRR
jgi:hypothetical protein